MRGRACQFFSESKTTLCPEALCVHVIIYKATANSGLERMSQRLLQQETNKALLAKNLERLRFKLVGTYARLG